MPSLPERWDRYLETLEAQLACLQGAEPDLARFQGLAQAREALARDIEAHGARAPAPGAERARLRGRMEACAAVDRAVLERLAELRGVASGAVKRSAERAPACSEYLAGARARAAEARRRIDVRS